jgi:Cytochrome P450
VSEYPDIMTDRQIGVLCAGNLFAGSQSPSHVLDTICNFFASSPSGQRKLYTELTDIKCTYPAILQQVQNMPYLDGVIKEGYRLHGVGFFILERVTLAAGLRLPSGHHLPAGIKVGISSHGLSRREDVFGYDCDEFKPERWTRHQEESEEAFAKRRLAMERCDMTFGHGSRVCIGKSIATMELYKVVATLVGLFEVRSASIRTDSIPLNLLKFHLHLARPCRYAKDVRSQRARPEKEYAVSMSLSRTSFFHGDQRCLSQGRHVGCGGIDDIAPTSMLITEYRSLTNPQMKPWLVDDSDGLDRTQN